MSKRFSVLLAAALSLAASCGGGGGGGSTPTLDFQVNAVTPPDRAEGVGVSAEVTVFFNRAVDPATVTDASVRVVAESGDVIFGSREFSAITPGLVRFHPIQPYFPFAVHRVLVTQEVRDRDGRPLDRDYTFEFQTETDGPSLPTPQDIENLGNELIEGRWFHRMTLLPNQRFLIAGGYTADNTPVDTAENFVYSTRENFAIPSRMSTPRAAHVQIQLNDGRVLLAGGEVSNEPFLPTARCDLFDPSTFLFAPVASMNVPRSFAHAALLDDGRVLVTGGQTNGPLGFHFLQDAEIYDPAADRWTLLASPLSAPRSGHFTARSGPGKVVVLGGAAGNPSTEVFRLDTLEFEPISPPPFFDHFLGAGTLLPDGRPILFGGFGTLGVTIHDPDFGPIYSINTMLSERVFATATAFADGRVIVAGGFDASQSPAIILDTIDLFYPVGKTGKVIRLPQTRLPQPTSHHAAARDPAGVIWITGGLPTDLANPALRQIVGIHPGS